MASSVPTTVTRSPNCSFSCGVAIRSTPLRLTRVMLAPRFERICNWLMLLPLMPGLVMRMRRVIKSSPNFSSLTCTFLPRRAMTGSTTVGLATICRMSPSLIRVWPFTTSSCLSLSLRIILETMKSRFKISLICLMVSPNTIWLVTCTEKVFRVIASRCPIPRLAAASSSLLLIRSAYLNIIKERITPSTPIG